jgi:glyoxylase-like metal-dependent hydrolase (beta-lactamase superfamily II)
MGRAAANLVAAGIDLQTINTVILTHGHIDHISGLVSVEDTLTFPNATYYMDEREWAYWTHPGLTLSEPIMPDALKQNFIQAARLHLPRIRDRVRLFTPNSELVPGITTLSAAGHTPGHTVLRIESDDQAMLHLVDVFHHPGFDLEHPHWQTVFDHDPDQAYETRRRLLDAVSAEGTLLLSYHMPFPGLGYVGQTNDHYRWIPQKWQF